MATIFSTDFEGYADGNASLVANGWLGSFHCAVVSAVAHGGSKSCMCGNDLTIAPFPDTIDGGWTIFRAIAPSTSSVSAEAWMHKAQGTPTPPQTQQTGGLIYLFHSAGTATIQAVAATGLGNHNHFDLRTVVGSTSTLWGRALDVLPNNEDDQYFSVKLQIHMSTVNATLDGVNPDGCMSVWVNGVLVLEMTEVDVFVTSTGWATGVNHPPDRVEFGNSVWVDDITVTDDVMVCGVHPREGSLCVGDQGTVEATRAVLFSLDGNTNSNTTPGLFKVAGNLEVTGTATFGGTTTSARLDGLGT
jgi:hypothetical protein